MHYYFVFKVERYTLLYVNPYKMYIIANFVKKRRIQAGLTQEEFTIKAGVASTVVVLDLLRQSG